MRKGTESVSNGLKNSLLCLLILISLLVFSYERKFPTKIPTLSNSEAPATLGVSGPESNTPVSIQIFGPDSSKIWTYVRDTAVDSQGNIFVSTSNELVKLSPSGTVISIWNAVNGYQYSALAIDSSDNIIASLAYLTGPVGDYIYIINSTTGAVIDSWATEGSGDGQLINVIDIAVDSNDNIYVSDLNSRVTKFDSAGNFLLKWTNGIESGFPVYTHGLVVDGNDDVYAAEGHMNGGTISRVRKYSPLGAMITEFGSSGSGDGQFLQIGAIEVDGTGNVFVDDMYSGIIQKFNSSHVFQTSWDTQLEGDGNGAGLSSITKDLEGNLLIARLHSYSYDTDGDAFTLTKYSTNGTFISHISHSYTEDGKFDYLFDITKNGSEILAFDYDQGKIHRFNLNGEFIASFGNAVNSGAGNGEFNLFLSGLAADSSGNLYAIEESRVQKFSSNGTYITEWGGAGSGDGEFSDPYGGLVVDSDDNVYVLDSGNDRVQKFDSDGNFLTKWGVTGAGNGEFDFPEGIAVDSENNVYVADSSNFRIQKFTSDGTYITQWGTEGTGDTEFQFPTGVGVDQFGNVYVTDSPYTVNTPGTIKLFDSSGTFIGKYELEGIGPGAPLGRDYTEDIYVSPTGDVYVAESNDHRIIKITFDRLPADVDITPFSGNQTYDTTPTIGGTVTDNLTNISSIQASLDGGNYANCSATDGTLNELSESFSCAYASSIGVGSHTITIRSTDSRANTNSGADLGTYTFTVLASATPTPTPTVTSTPTATASATPTATATPTDSLLPSVTTTPTFGIIDTPLATLSPTPSTTQGSNIPESCLDFSDLTVSDTIIKRGSEVLITWEALCTEQIVMQPSGDVLAAKGSKRFSPTETTVYEFTAINKGKSVTKKVTVQVVDTLPWTGTIAAGSGLLLLEAVVALQQPVIFGNIWLSLAGLVRKKKRNAWGVVYDSISKRPLGRVVIRLMNAENKVTDTAVSDANGTFVLAAKQGSYTISAKLGGYSFPSKIISGTIDGAFGNVYVGSVVNVTGDTSGLLVSIPLDPESLSDADRVRANAKQQFPKIIEGLSTLLVVCGALYSLIVLWQFPHNLNLLISSVYFFALLPKILRRFGTETQGSVLYEDGTPAANIEIGLFDSEFKTLLYRTFTNKDGKYTLAVPNVNYDLKLLDQKYKLVYGGKQQLSVSINKKGNAGVRIIALDLIVKS